MRVFNYIIIILIAIIFGCNSDKNKDKIEASGTIEATNIIVSSRTNGQILSIIKDEGQRVGKGDTLAIIDTEILRLQLDQALAQEEIAAAQLKLIKIGARKEDIMQAEENFNSASINYEAIKKDYERMKNLFENKVISEKQYDDVKTKYDLALTQLNVAKENLTKVKKIFRPEEITQAEANYKKAKANSDLLKKNIADSYVLSPLDGVIVKKFIENGEMVSPMSNLFKVSNLSVVKLVIYISTEEMPLVKLNAKVDIKIDAFKDKTYKGKVLFISPEAEFTPKNIQTKDERTKQVFAVKIEIENQDFELKPGLPADASIILN